MKRETLKTRALALAGTVLLSMALCACPSERSGTDDSNDLVHDGDIAAKRAPDGGEQRKNDGLATTKSGGWVRRFAGSREVEAAAITTNNRGVVCLGGTFDEQVTFGGHVVKSAGERDAFIACYDSRGRHLWSHAAGGTGPDLGTDIAVDVEGEVVLVGRGSGGEKIASGLSVAKTGTTGFVARFGEGGTARWGRKVGGSHPVAVEIRDDDIIVLGGGTPAAEDPPRQGFLERLSLSGERAGQWNIGNGDGVTVDVAVLGAEGVTYVAGGFNATLRVGGRTVRSSGDKDVFVLAMSRAGRVLWLVRSGGSRRDEASAIALDSEGRVLVTGQLGRRGAARGNGPSARSDVFLTCLSADDGQQVWSKRFRSEVATATGVAAGQGGGSCISGAFTPTLDIAGTILTVAQEEEEESPPTGTPRPDGFVVCLDAEGSHSWSRTFGGLGADGVVALAIDRRGGIFVAGTFENQVSVEGVRVVSGAGADLLIVRYQGPIAMPMAMPQPAMLELMSPAADLPDRLDEAFARPSPVGGLDLGSSSDNEPQSRIALSRSPLSQTDGPESESVREIDQQITRRAGAALRTCYATRLRRVPTLAGVATVRFTVAPSGRVTEIDVDHEGLDTQVSRCITRTIRRLRLPGTEAGDTMFEQRISFSPGT